jgi:hypothetical protein
MKTKKAIFAMLAVTLLVSAALIIGCMNPMDEISGQKGSYKPQSVPAGKGLIRFNLSNNARTILPDQTTAFEKENLFYNVVFTPVSGTAITHPTSGALSYDDFDGAAIALAVDATGYNILVTAYDDASKTTPIAGWTSPARVPVASGVSTPVTADLIGITDGAKTGKFKFNITYNTLPSVSTTQLTTLDYTSQTLDIKKYGTNTAATVTLSGSSVTLPIPLSSIGTPNTNATAYDIPSGYYTVTVKLVADNCQDRVVEHVMHIYPSMTSTYATSTPIPAPNQNTFTVKYDATNASVSNITFGTGGVYTVTSANAQTLTEPTTPTSDSHTFASWHTLSSLTDASKWTFGASGNKVFKDTILYAKWAQDGITFTITFTFSDQGTLALASGAGSDTFSYNEIAGTGAVSFSLTGNTFTSVVWKLDGQQVYQATPGATVTLNKNTLLDSTDGITGTKFLDMLNTGPLTLSVSAFVGTTPYSANYTLTVAN